MKIIGKQNIKGEIVIVVELEDGSFQNFTEEEFRNTYPNEKNIEYNSNDISQVDFSNAGASIGNVPTKRTYKRGTPIATGGIPTYTGGNEIGGCSIVFGIIIIVLFDKYSKQIWSFFKNIQLIITIVALLFAIFIIISALKTKRFKFAPNPISSGLFGGFLGFGASMLLCLPITFFLLLISIGSSSKFVERFNDMFQFLDLMVVGTTISGAIYGGIKGEFRVFGGCVIPCIIFGIIGAFLLFIGYS